MKKLLLIIFLLVIIFLSFGFAYLKISSNGLEYSDFNSNFRPRIAKYPLMRKIVGLHYDGDAKHDYSGRKTEKIIIEVDSMKGLGIEKNTIEKLAEKIRDITRKETFISYSDIDIPFSQTVSPEELRNIYKTNKYNRPGGNTAVIYILIANSDSENPNQLGTTLNEDGLVFFQSNLRKLYNEDNKKNYNNIILGTLLHEFGHQLGLGHNDYESCLMNSTNIYDTNLSSKGIVFEFCEREIMEIENIKNNLL